MTQRQPQRPQREWAGRWLVGLLAFAALSHATYLANGLTWLDQLDVAEKAAIVPLSRLAEVFSAPFAGSQWYRPMTQVVYSLDHALYGDWAPGFHLTNLLLHLACCASLFFLGRQVMGASPASSAIGAALFSVHPANALPVGAINARTDLLAATGCFAALLCLDAFCRRPRPLLLLGVGGLLLAGMLAKETALPFGVVAALALLATVHQRSSRRHRLLGAAAVAGAAAISLALRHAALGGLSARLEPGGMDLVTHLHVLGRFVARYLLFPWPPPLSDAVPRARLDVSSVVGLVEVGLLVAAGWRWRGDRRARWLGVAFAASLLPVLHLVAIPRALSPHYAYLSTALLGLTVGAGLEAAPARWRRPLTALALAGGLVCAGATLAFGRRLLDDVALFAPEVARDSHYREGRFYLGLGLLRAERPTEAAAMFGEALREDPAYLAYLDEAGARLNRGAALMASQDLARAEPELFRALELVAPSLRARAAYNLALARYRLGRRQAALDTLRVTEGLRSPPEVALLRAQLHADLGQVGPALAAMLELRGRLVTPDQVAWHARLVRQLEGLIGPTGEPP